MTIRKPEYRIYGTPAFAIALFEVHILHAKANKFL